MTDPSSPALGTVTETQYSDEDIREYFRNRLLSFDRYAMTLAEVVGLTIFPGGDVRENIRPSSLPMLWNDGEQPLVSWCRNNDWWVRARYPERQNLQLRCKRVSRCRNCGRR